MNRRRIPSLAKASRVDGYLRSVDSAPFTPEEFAGITRQALRRAIELPRVCDVLGANLAETAHEALCGSVADPLGEKSGPAKGDALDPAGWVKERLPLDHFEEALKVSTEGEEKLWRDIQDGRAAVDRLLHRYERLALQLARARRGQGLPVKDLDSVAREGLWKAILSFRPEEGNQFSTYATTVIQHEIATAFRDAPGVGSYLTRRAAEFTEKREKLVAELGREVSDAEVYESLGWSSLERENFAKGKPLLAPQSLDADSPDGREPGAAGPEIEPLDELVLREDRIRVNAALKQLDEISQRVIRLRYYGAELLSQRAVGVELGLSREKVRDIEEAALTSLKRMLEEAERPKSPVEKA